MNTALQISVRRRAGHRCEYCRLHQDDVPFYTFPVDHIIAGQHDGPTVATNLALSCLRCNLHKGPNIAGRDPLTKKLTPLFHPRRHKWAHHFRFVGPRVMGLTAIGRTTVKILAMNHPDAVALRESLRDE
jgi:hypothetical protein